MLAKRIIPCLDIKNGKTVKGINFENLIYAGDPVELAKRYADQGADELVFLDITATNENRGILLELVQRIAMTIDIPFTVGGGVRSVDDARKLLRSGADKVTINSAAIKSPQLINDLAANFGSQCIVLAIDAKETEGKWEVYSNGGRVSVGRDLYDWAKEGESRGAGEILFTAMNNDGTKNGFSNKALRQLSDHVGIPVIASGGAGKMVHFVDAFTKGNADAALAASVFHFNEFSIPSLKQMLANLEIPVRL